MARTEEEHRENFVNDPTSMESFSALRRTYQGDERWADLAWLYSERARAPLEDNRKADMFFKAADLYFDQLNDDAAGVDALYNGVLLDPRHRRNSRKLKEILKEKKDNERYLYILEKEIELLEEQGTDKRGLSQLHFEAGELFSGLGGRNADALKHFRESFRNDQQNVKALNCASELLVSEKMYEEALPLLEYQLKTIREPHERAEKLEIIGRIKLEEIRDVMAAEAALKEAISLVPDKVKYLYTLGEIYSDRRYPAQEAPLKNARVFLNIARLHQQSSENEKAVNALKQSISLDPFLDESFSLLATIYEQNSDYQALSDLLDKGGHIHEGQTRLRLLVKRAAILETHLGNPGEARRIYFELLEESPESIIPRLVMSLEKEENYQELAKLREKELTLYRDNTKIVETRLSLVRLFRDHLNRPDKAAGHIHEILTIEPENLEALDLYITHFREKGDRKSQVDTMEFALEVARKQRASKEYVISVLKEMADIYHRHLGDLGKTERCLSMLARIEPENDRFQQALAKIVQKREMWEGYKTDLMADIENAASQGDKIYAMKNLASALSERRLDVSLNIKLYQEILGMDPTDEDAFYGLEDLFHREGDMESLYRMYEMRLDGATPEQQEEILSSMFELAREKLMDPNRIGRTAAKLLEIDPSHEEALKALIDSLEALENWPKLAAVLEKYANSLYDPAEKCEYFIKAADVYMGKLRNESETIRLLSGVVSEHCYMETTVPRLLELYEKSGRYDEYVKLAEESIHGGYWPGEPSEEGDSWKKVGQVFERNLENLDKALECWQRVLEIDENDSEALISLARISYFTERWDILAETMERQVSLSENPDQKQNLLGKLADIYMEKLSQPDDALRIIEQIPESDRGEELEQKQASLYRVLGESEKAISLYQKWLDNSTIPQDRIRLLLALSDIYINELHEMDKASGVLDEVLQLEPSNMEALKLQRKLCVEEGKYERLSEILRTLLDISNDDEEILTLFEELGDVYSVHLEDFSNGFLNYFEAFRRAPLNEELGEKAEKTARDGQLYNELVKYYNYILGRTQDIYEEKEFLTKLIEVLEIKMENPKSAMDVLSRYVLKYPLDDELLVEAERVGRTFEEGRLSLLSLYEHIINNIDDRVRKSEFLITAAKLCEKEMNDQPGALKRYERAYRANPFHEDLIPEIERLSRNLGEWDIFNAIQIPVLSAMIDPLDKVDHLLNVAQVLETEAGAPVRAFRVYLHAFLTEPGNSKITDNIWRLAEKIKLYTEDQRKEIPIRSDSVLVGGIKDFLRGEDAFRAQLAKGSTRRPEVTQEIDFDELEVVESSFQELDPEDLSEFRKSEMTGPTHSLTMQDLLESRTGSYQEVSQVIEEYGGDVSYKSVTEVASSEMGGVIGSNGELPPPESPWEEFARAWAMLPSKDTSERVSHLKEMARIWLDGAQEPQKAFNVFGRAFTINPADEEVASNIYEIAGKLQSVDKLAFLYSKVASQSSNELAIELYSVAAGYFRELGDAPHEEDMLRAILALEPGHEKAYEDLLEKLRKESAWNDILALMEWRFDLFRSEMSLEDIQNFYLDMARLNEEKVFNPDAALIFRLKYLENEPDHVESLEKVVSLGTTINAWGKVAEALRKLADISDDESTIVSTLMHLASISGNELELPDQAINVYREVISIDSSNLDALNALDSLYVVHELWEELENILIKLSAMEEDPNKNRVFKDRMCEVLEKLDREEEAAVIYKELWEQTRETRYAVRASNMYMEMGEPSAGVEILSNLLSSDEAQYGAAEKASMWTNLAKIQKRSLKDMISARKSLENALELSPDHIESLNMLSEIQYEDRDWEKFVQTQLHISEVTDDQDEKQSCLFIAGRTCRDELADIEKAEQYFDRVVKLNAGHMDAIMALQSIYEMQQNFTRVYEIISVRLKNVTSPSEIAKLLSSQAYIALNNFNDDELAYRLLTEALGHDQSSVDAILTLADLAQAREEWEQASDLLENALKKTRDEPEKSARLGRRYAQLMDMQGKAENAVTLLQELDRKYPDELLIKLTLGEIRFKSGRWRETVKILSGLGDHPMVSEYPEEVAAALCMAATSEMKQRKGFLPRELWETAVKIKPDYLPAIESLIEYHLSRGEEVEGATYLKAQAEAAESSEVRIKLFRSLADLYRDKLRKPDLALDCYLECYNLLDYVTEDEQELLKIIADIASERGRLNEVYEILKDLISFVPESEKMNYLIMAGDVALSRGLVDEAASWLEDAQKRAPANEKVLLALSELYEKSGKTLQAVSTLETLLDRKTGLMAEEGRRSSIQGRLGRLYSELGDDEKACLILEECLASDEPCLDYQKLIVSIYDRTGVNPERLAFHQNKLLSSHPVNPQLIKLLADNALKSGDHSAGYLYCQLLDVMQQPFEEHQQFYNEQNSFISRVELSWDGRLDENDRELLSAGADTHGMTEIFEALWEAAPSIFGTDLSSLGLYASDKVSPVDKSDLAIIYSEVSKVLGDRKTGLYMGRDKYSGVTVACHAPPLIVIGDDTITNNPSTLRFLLARSIMLANPRFIMAAGFYPEEFSKFISALMRAFHPKYSRRQFKTLDPIDEKASQLKNQVPYRVSKSIIDMLAETGEQEFNSGHWRRNVWMIGNRAGLLLSGDLKEVIRLLVYEETGDITDGTATPEKLLEYSEKVPAIRDILSFHISPTNMKLREKLLGR
ncbi:MAG: tetratricopeptide repeat protein [Deltaproteobacteria bacterium]|nr:tetratricopeptide repeat protein [Deltaproteobacteria bacterium]